jgi:diguanylate cyclase (GGDEF)-like protein
MSLDALSPSLSDRPRRMEYIIAWVRLIAVPALLLVFLGWPERSSGQTLAVLCESIFTIPYAVAVVLLRPWRSERIAFWSTLTAAIDYAAILTLVFISGGASSPFVPTLIAVLAATAMRFGSVGVLLSGTALSLPLMAWMFIDGITAEKGFALSVSLASMWLVGIGLAALRRDEERQHDETLRLALDTVKTTVELEVARRQASADGLTGLSNYSSFYTALDALFASGQQMAVLYADLDRFKHVNDYLGHPVGDDVLCSFANRLRMLLPSDAVGARLGGDEFAVLLPNEGLAGADALAHDVRKISITAGDTIIVASVGTAERANAREAREMMLRADRAMFEEKTRRRSARAA